MQYFLKLSLTTGEPAKRKVLDWPTRLSIALGAARGKSILYYIFNLSSVKNSSSPDMQ